MIKTYVSCYSKPLAETAIPWLDSKHSTYGRKEIDCWLYQLRRTFPAIAKSFVIKERFTSSEELQIKFWEVVLEYEDSEINRQQAFTIVDNLPYEWDEKSREFLGSKYFDYIMRLKCPQDFPEQKDPFEQT